MYQEIEFVDKLNNILKMQVHLLFSSQFPFQLDIIIISHIFIYI